MLSGPCPSQGPASNKKCPVHIARQPFMYSVYGVVLLSQTGEALLEHCAHGCAASSVVPCASLGTVDPGNVVETVAIAGVVAVHTAV